MGSLSCKMVAFAAQIWSQVQQNKSTCAFFTTKPLHLFPGTQESLPKFWRPIFLANGAKFYIVKWRTPFSLSRKLLEIGGERRFLLGHWVRALISSTGKQWGSFYKETITNEFCFVTQPVAELTERVQMELVYPSQLQLSKSLPPLPLAQTKMLPFPARPLATPWRKARVARRPGPSTVRPSSSGPQLGSKIQKFSTLQDYFLTRDSQYCPTYLKMGQKECCWIVNNVVGHPSIPCRIDVDVIAVKGHRPGFYGVCDFTVQHSDTSNTSVICNANSAPGSMRLKPW